LFPLGSIATRLTTLIANYEVITLWSKECLPYRLLSPAESYSFSGKTLTHVYIVLVKGESSFTLRW
jgi:hypothetical protein